MFKISNILIFFIFSNIVSQKCNSHSNTDNTNILQAIPLSNRINSYIIDSKQEISHTIQKHINEKILERATIISNSILLEIFILQCPNSTM